MVEAWFHRSGYIILENMHEWGEENPHEIHRESIHLEKIVVCVPFPVNKLLVPYFSINLLPW